MVMHKSAREKRFALGNAGVRKDYRIRRKTTRGTAGSRAAMRDTVRII